MLSEWLSGMGIAGVVNEPICYVITRAYPGQTLIVMQQDRGPPNTLYDFDIVHEI